MRKSLISLVLLFVVGSAFAEQAATERFEKVVGRMVEAINEANYPGIQADFSQIMLDAFPLEKLTPFFQSVSAQYGKIQKLGQPRYIPPNQAIFPAYFERGVLDIKVVLDMQDKIIGLWFLPHVVTDIPVPEKHETELSLPFKDRWLVFWGGDTKELNMHHDVPNQQFAFDFIGVNEDGAMHSGEGKANEDYFSFGREVLVPADGTVTDVIEGVRDNVPGSMNPYSGLGNAVFIQHREHEISVLAHLKLGSIKVKVGDKVKAGQVIGLCGNSGNSSQPHLHYHLQNTPVIQDGTGIKCYFQKMNVIEDGKKQAKMNYSPIKGQIVVAE
ncbi:MAG: peptidoglycan DD-metalloendopeptidase family protein [Planctomycetota bacterium]|nr:MAG: peptidoglycan DD-metalloendopeptidase family protein [Planctomycetota bacterium]